MKTKREMKNRRESRKIRIRKRLRGTDERPRLSIYKSCKFTYCQVITDGSVSAGISSTMVSASTQEKEVMDAVSSIKAEEAGNSSRSSKSVTAAKALGLVLARRAKEKNITRVVFDRNGFSYTGRIKAVADGAREGGLEF